MKLLHEHVLRLWSSARANRNQQRSWRVASAMLILGILYQIKSTLGLRSQRGAGEFYRLARGRSNLPVPLMLLLAMLLLIIGLLATADM